MDHNIDYMIKMLEEYKARLKLYEISTKLDYDKINKLTEYIKKLEEKNIK